MEKELSVKELQIELACHKLALTFFPNFCFIAFAGFATVVLEIMRAVLGGEDTEYVFTLKGLWTDFVPALVLVVNILSVIKNFVFSAINNPKWTRRIAYTNYFDESVCFLGVVYCFWLLIKIMMGLPLLHWATWILCAVIIFVGGLLFASCVKVTKLNKLIIHKCDEHNI